MRHGQEQLQPGNRRTGFIDWTLVAAAGFALLALAGGLFAFVAYEKRAAQERSDLRTPEPPAVQSVYYEADDSVGGN